MATPPPVPDLLLERLLAGELPPAEAEALRRRLEAEPGGLERLEALDASNRQILRDHPPEAVAREVARRARQAAGDRALASRPWPRRLGLVLVPAGLVAAALLTTVPPPHPPPTAQTAAEITRSKGLRPGLFIYRQLAAPTGAEELADGARVRAGDTLQVGYNAAGRPFGAILSIDGRGVVTLHHPLRSDRPPTLTTTGKVSLPRSYRLDDAPGFERFFMITADAPFDVAKVVAAGERLVQEGSSAQGRLPLPEGLDQLSITLVKNGSPR